MRTVLVRAVIGPAFLALVAGAVLASQQSMTRLLPGATDLSGWRELDGTDAWGDKQKAFFDILDGGAEEYTNAGGREIATRAFKHEKKILQVTVIDMTDSKKAKAFCEKRRQGFVGKPGYAALQVKSGGFCSTQSGLASGYLWCGRYYAELSVNGSSAAEVSALKAAAQLVSTKARKGS